MSDDNGHILQELENIRACMFAILGVMLQMKRHQDSRPSRPLNEELVDARQWLEIARQTLGQSR
jgi:hypothetical protein